MCWVMKQMFFTISCIGNIVELTLFIVSHLWQQFTQMQNWFIGPVMCQVMKLVLFTSLICHTGNVHDGTTMYT